jgi:hypothetical protein
MTKSGLDDVMKAYSADAVAAAARRDGRTPRPPGSPEDEEIVERGSTHGQ